MSCSAKITLRTDYGRDSNNLPRTTRADGSCTVVLQVIINREVLRFDVGTHWYPEYWDRAAGRALPRHRGDTSADDVNLEAGKAAAEANGILVRYRLLDAEPTAAEFRREFRNPISRTDFIAYYARKAWERYRAGSIEKLTYDTQMSSLKAVKAFAKKLPFVALARKNFAARFEEYLIADGKRPTTRWARHKDVKTYLNLAKKDEHIAFADPYADFKVKKGKTARQAMHQREIQLIDAYYRTLPEGTPVRPVLRRWLFSLASCGMRISDACRVERDWLFEDVLIFKPWKGRRRGDRQIRVVLGERALELWAEAVRELDHPHYVFTDLTGQKSNDWLKEVAAELGIKTNIFNHQARRTFGSLYLANGGQLPSLQDYFGHADISSTMIYVDVMPAQRREEAKKVDAIFGATTSPAPAGRRALSWRTPQSE